MRIRSTHPSLLIGCAAFALAANLPAADLPGGSCRVNDPELQTSYVGDCRDGLAHGRGSASGTASYEGGFKSGSKHGRGVKTWASGDRYAGEFQDDRRHGSGSYTWGRQSPWAGAAYMGKFANDRRHGHGVFEWPSGDRYEGEWRDDLRLGPTVFEQRRSTWRGAAEAAMGRRGVRVCRDWPIGGTEHAPASGVTQAYDGRRLTVRIEAAPDGTVWHEGTTLKPGALVSGALLDWRPC